jgi:c(7)-type cytochrome triheme protein
MTERSRMIRLPGLARVALVGVGAVALMAALLTASPGIAQVKIPPDFAFEQGEESPGPVTFSHTKHRDAGVDKCTACHTKVFKMKKGQTGPLTMAKMQAGEQCGACHTGKTRIADKVVFAVTEKANCEQCHKK